MDQKHEILHSVFGYTTFRSGQEALIDALLAGRDAFGIMPTGGGKSVCYQIPALILEGITLVVSPLISLMADQVAALKSSGVAAAYINSSLTPEQLRLVYRNMVYGRYKIIYIAPERLQTEGFRKAAESVRISMLAVDEAHCISQWGQDFRPSYLRIAEFLKELPYRPVVSAFTATATAQVREDVIRLLELREPYVEITGFDRPNLRFEVRKPKDKAAALVQLLAERRGKCGIVYCSTRKDVEKICQLLQDQGFSATRYHAGLEPEERRSNQDDFVCDRSAVMVATNAFGMGINKSNVSFVIHYNMPQSMEAYYQEAGRAGRDGLPADCILLYAAGDIQTAQFLIRHPSENELLTPEEQSRVMECDLARLDKMITYCKTESCLRGCILDYFGQAHAESCGNCSNCDEDAVQTDITIPAQMILSCTQQIYRRLGYYLGAAAIAQILRGSSEKRIRELGLNALPTYGLMKNMPRADVRSVMDTLEAQGYLQTNREHGGVYPTGKAREVLFAQKKVYMRSRSREEAVQGIKPANPVDENLLSTLKALRLQLAKEAKVPAYIIFSNATLQDMAAKAPQTPEEFLRVDGVGKFKAAQYAEIFLAEIQKYLEKN